MDKGKQYGALLFWRKILQKITASKGSHVISSFQPYGGNNRSLQPASCFVSKLQILEVIVYSLDDPTKVLDTMYIKALE
jgi:hypothetical protein